MVGEIFFRQMTRHRALLTNRADKPVGTQGCHNRVTAHLNSRLQTSIREFRGNTMDARTPNSDTAVERGWRPDRCDRVALVLQGGGALGAYQAGVYQALHEEGMEPDWVCGVSIGAIN